MTDTDSDPAAPLAAPNPTRAWAILGFAAAIAVLNKSAADLSADIVGTPIVGYLQMVASAVMVLYILRFSTRAGRDTRFLMEATAVVTVIAVLEIVIGMVLAAVFVVFAGAAAAR